MQPTQTLQTRLTEPPPEALRERFSPPPDFEGDYGEYRPPLLFESGERVDDAEDWELRREEILEKRHGIMGEWPDVLEDPEVTFHESTVRGRHHSARHRGRPNVNYREPWYLGYEQGAWKSQTKSSTYSSSILK